MNLLRKLLGKESSEGSFGDARSHAAGGERRVCGLCGREFVGTALEVEDLGFVGIRKRFHCPHCHAEMNYFDKSQ